MKDIKDIYKSTYSKAQAPEDLKSKVSGLSKSPKGRRAKIARGLAIAAVTVLVCFVLSNFATLVTSGSFWIENIVAKHLNEEIVTRNEDGIPLVHDEEEEHDDLEQQFDRSMIRNYNLALEKGYIFQYEEFLNEEMVHDYRFIKAFTADELENAEFSNDYSRIYINGEPYVIKWGYTGEHRLFSPEEGELFPELLKDDFTVILRVFTEENWKEGREAFAREIFEGVKRDTIIPIVEGDVCIINNEDSSARDLTEEELNKMSINSNGTFAKIEDVYYVVTYDWNQETSSSDGIILRPLEGYPGDAQFVDPEKYPYFTIEDWMVDY